MKCKNNNENINSFSVFFTKQQLLFNKKKMTLLKLLFSAYLFLMGLCKTSRFILDMLAQSNVVSGCKIFML